MALEADVPAVDDVRLVGIERVAEDARRAGGQIEDVVVPLERGEALAAAEPALARGSFHHVDLDPADPSSNT